MLVSRSPLYDTSVDLGGSTDTVLLSAGGTSQFLHKIKILSITLESLKGEVLIYCLVFRSKIET